MAVASEHIFLNEWKRGQFSCINFHDDVSDHGILVSTPLGGVELVQYTAKEVELAEQSIIWRATDRPTCLHCAGDVEKIIDHVLGVNGRHAAYNKLAVLGDMFGSRLTGSEALEQAISEYTHT